MSAPRPALRRIPPERLDALRVAAAAFAGGALGSFARGGAELVFAASGWPGWPSRIAVNVAGAFAIGWLFARLSPRDGRGVPLGIPHARRLAEHRWGAGFLGGFTTVSGFAWDAASAAGAAGEPSGARLALVLGSNAVLGIGAAWLGWRMGASRIPAVR